MRIRLTLAYNGGEWHGWQIQERANPPPTIQGETEKALLRIYGQKIRVHGAGRTDAGVHAHAQEAHCDVPRMLPDLRHSLNAVLPRSIRILAVREACPWFHARKDARAKTYIYQFWRETAFMPPKLAQFAWNCGALDIEAMRNALPFFAGRADFAALQNSGSCVEDTVRNINFIRLQEMPQEEFYPPHASPLRLVVNADGFLKQMVRNIAGALVWIGRGKFAARDLPVFLAQKSRGALPSPTAPACGLALAAIDYGEQTKFQQGG